MVKRKSIRFLGVTWDTASFIVFLLGIFGFVVGILIILFFSPVKVDLIGVVISLSSLMVSIFAATRGQIENLGSGMAAGFSSIGKKLFSMEEILKEIGDKLRR